MILLSGNSEIPNFGFFMIYKNQVWQKLGDKACILMTPTPFKLSLTNC